MNEPKKIFILLGHPDKETYSGSFAAAYDEAAREAGHEVRRMHLGEIPFDPILHKGYKEIQQLEPGLIEIQENIKWADHFVLVYPNWWNTMPALLKGFFDRAWIPGFAFNFDKQTKKIIQRLKGKTAHVIIISGSFSPFMIWWKFGDFKNEIQRGILEFAGFETKVTTYGPAERVNDEQREHWIDEVKGWAKQGI